MNMTVLVLGAAGFIGRHLVETLAADGLQVLAATRQPAQFRNPAIVNVVSPFIAADEFLPLVSRCQAVVHAAASSTPGSSAAQPQLDGNLRTTLALIEALQEHAAAKVVFLSSGGTVYGNTPVAVTETAPLQPRSYHAAGKIAAEFFLGAWARQYSGALTILRPSNVYGPGQPLRAGFGIIPTAFERALQGTPLQVLGDGSAQRDYLYIDDLVQLLRLLIAAPRAAGIDCFNVASGTVLSLNALLDLVDRVTGKPLLRSYDAARRVDVNRVLLDAAAVRAAFGWAPQMDIEQGLRLAWAWRQQCP